LKPDAGSVTLMDALRRLSWARAGRGDQVSNVLLYAPLGFCLLLWLEAQMNRWAAAILAVLAGASLSYCIEVGQVYISMRVPSTQDVTLNAFGTVLGVTGAVVWRALSRLVYLPKANGSRRDGRSALIVLLLWLGWRFAPYTAQFHLAHLKAAFRPLIHPTFVFSSVVSALICWLIVAQLLFRIVDRQRGIEALLATIAAVLVGRLLLAGQGFDPSELLALVLLLPAVVLVNRLWSEPQSTFLVLALCAVLIQRLAPFDFNGSPHTLDLWPFLGWIEAGMPIDAAPLMEKAFLFGALIWLLRDTGLSSAMAMTLGVGFIFVLEIVQLWQINSAPSVTNPVLALLVGLLLHYSAVRPSRLRLR
jgi:glycopeptide antibiotics resistance protein